SACAMEAPALPAPSTTVRPFGGAGRCCAMLCSGCARCTAARYSASRKAGGSERSGRAEDMVAGSVWGDWSKRVPAATTRPHRAAPHGPQKLYTNFAPGDYDGRMEASTTGFIAERLTRAIARHRLLPGTKLAEQKLADHFGVSRTLVRQALFQLSQNRLVRLE